jgi:hypothetical protein
MADSSLNRRMTGRLANAVALAQIGIVGLDGQIELVPETLVSPGTAIARLEQFGVRIVTEEGQAP